MEDDPIKLWTLFRNIALKRKWSLQDSKEIAGEAWIIWNTTKQRNAHWCVTDAIRKIYGCGMRGNWLKHERSYGYIQSWDKFPVVELDTDRIDLQDVIGRMKPEDAQIFSRWINGHTQEEIGAWLGVTGSAICLRMRRLLAKECFQASIS